MIDLLILVSFGLSIYLGYLSIYRAWTIVNLDKEILDEKKRKELIEPLKILIFFAIAGVIMSILAYIIPVFVLKCVLGILPTILCANSMGTLQDELEKFDLSLKEAKDVKEFLEEAEKDAVRKSK